MITKISSIIVESNNIGDEGLTLLSQNLNYIRNLIELDISDNSIGDEGIKSFSNNIKHINNIMILNIGCINYLYR